jgi:hypothetical protein
MTRVVIPLHAESPSKPPTGQACNGCGACCAWEPCPLGMLLSRRRSGACVALEWHAGPQHYRCGALTSPSRWLPRPLAWASPLLARLARRWIAAGQGCDFEAELSGDATSG